MKIAVLHDFFEIRGGGERLVIELAKHLDADLIYGFWTKNSYSLTDVRGRSLNAYTPIIGWRTVKQIRAFQCLRNLDQYDVVLYSGNDALFARSHRTRGRNIFYCHTPPRYIYDKRDFYFRAQNLIGKLFLRMLTKYVQPRYEAAVKSMDTVVTNSEHTKQRIKQYLGIDATVVYPPCDTTQFRWVGQGDYYLSTARLDDLKNVNIIVRAFQKLPAQKLVIVSGGVREAEIRRLAQGHDNITVRGWVSDDELTQLIGNCIATVYVPTDEDFGMSPVESMAAGKPVIGVASGGLTETIVHKETGILLRPDFSVDNLCEIIAWMTPEQALAMRAACEQRAQQFSRDRFVREMEQLVRAA